MEEEEKIYTNHNPIEEEPEKVSKREKKILTFGNQPKGSESPAEEIIREIEAINRNDHHEYSIDQFLKSYKKFEKFIQAELQNSRKLGLS